MENPAKAMAGRGEVVLAALAGAANAFLTIRIWMLVSAGQPTWPFPALYFIELAILGLGCVVAYVASHPYRATVTWVLIGVLAAFSVLAAWTVGLYYVPVTAMFVLLAVTSDIRHRGNLLAHAVLALLAAVLQAAAILMLARQF